MENKLGINSLFSDIMPYLKTLASWKKKFHSLLYIILSRNVKSLNSVHT